MASSPSLFELPAAPGPRRARIFVVVMLNLILAGAGAAMIASYLAKRAEAENQSAPSSELEPPSPTASEPTPEVNPAPEPPPDKVLAASVGGQPGAGDGPDKKPTKSTGARPAGPEPGKADETDEYADQIDALASRHQGQLHGCYRRATRRADPETALEGRVDIRFRIMPDGRATGGRAVANTTGSEPLAACLVEVVEGWEFPPGASKPLDFVWPFRFRSLKQP